MNNNTFPPGSRLVFYARDSGGRDQDLSISQQQQAAGDWCKSNGYILTRIFADAARSGTSLAGRDQFLEMMAYLSSSAPESGLVIWEYARLARDFDDAQFYLADLRRRGITVYSISDAIPDSLDGRFMEAAINWKNAAYSKRLSIDVRRGQQYIILQHHAVLGGTPLGYKRLEVQIGRRRDGSPHTISQLAIDEAVAPLIRRAFEMRAAGATMEEIHKEVALYPWIKNYSYMFRNSRYAGQANYNGIDVPDYCPAIIDPDTWKAVQALMDERASKHAYNHPRAVRSRYILSGLLKCGECGAPMVGRVLKRKSLPDYLSYSCTGRTNLSRTCWASLIRKELIEERVITAVKDRILIPAQMEAAYHLARTEIISGDTILQAEIQRAKADLSSLEKSIARLLAAIRDAGHSQALLADLASLEEQQHQASERLARLETARPREMPDMDMVEVVTRIRQKLDAAPPVEVSTALRGFIISVCARKPRGKELDGEIKYRLPALGLAQEYIIPL